jgi:hypothetical protein
MYLLAVFLTGLAAYAFGARWVVLLLAVLLGLLPVLMVVAFLARLLVPPILRLSDDYSLNLSAKGAQSHLAPGQAQTELIKKDKPS